MLVIVLFGVIILYVALYVAWTMAGPHLDASNGSVMTVLRAVHEATLMPQSAVFVILRGLILATLLYVICDALLSLGRRRAQARRRREEDARPVQGHTIRNSHIAIWKK